MPRSCGQSETVETTGQEIRLGRGEAGTASSLRTTPGWGLRLVLCGLLAVTIAHSAPAIDSLSAYPLTIRAGGPRVVTVTAVILDQSLITASPNGLQVDATWKTLAILGTMHDDGKGGDAVTGDPTVTLQVILVLTGTLCACSPVGMPAAAQGLAYVLRRRSAAEPHPETIHAPVETLQMPGA